jgi:hypothetical protein
VFDHGYLRCQIFCIIGTAELKAKPASITEGSEGYDKKKYKSD